MTLPFNVKDFHPGYVSMTVLGEMFGVSSHRIGGWLREIDWRTPENSPSSMAFDRDLARATSSGRNGGYFYVWHATKAIEALKKAGHTPVA